MSSGLYRSLEEATGTDYVNKDIVQMVVEQVCIMRSFLPIALTASRTESFYLFFHRHYILAYSEINHNSVSNLDDFLFPV